MCGFVGYVSASRRERIPLGPAAERIRSRGPDMHGVTEGSRFAVAFNRLAINDLTENGMQPFEYDDLVVFMNGELFNHIELAEAHRAEFTPASTSDVEILPFLYRKYGLGCLDMLNGMFAAVIIDRRTSELLLIRDRYGQKPLYYHQRGETLFFASEVKALKEVLDLQVDSLSIAVNFSCWFLPQGMSLYKDTRNVAPGSLIRFRDGTMEEHRWYAPSLEVEARTDAQIEREFLERFDHSVELRLRSDVPVGIFLSGGVDSTSIAAAASRLSKRELIGFTADIVGRKYTEYGEPTPDQEVPGRLAAELGMDHVRRPVDYEYFDRNIVRIVASYDEILVSSGLLVFYALAESARRRGVGVMLAGVGGDELFGGYPWQQLVRRLPRRLVELTNFRLGLPHSPRLARRLYGDGDSRRAYLLYQMLTGLEVWHARTLGGNFLPGHLGDRMVEVEEALLELGGGFFDVARRSVRNDLYNQIQFANVFTVLGSQNHFTDIASMAHSIENRSPFLDVHLFEYMMAVPDSSKTRFGQKELLRRIMRTRLPDYVLDAPKSGPTVPVGNWFHDPHRRLLVNSFVSRHLGLVHDFLSYDLANRLRKDIDFMHRDQPTRSFALLSFVLWALNNIEGRCIEPSTPFREVAGS